MVETTNRTNPELHTGAPDHEVLARTTVGAFHEVERRKNTSLLDDRNRRLSAYNTVIQQQLGDQAPAEDTDEYRELYARTMLTGELHYLVDQPKASQAIARVQFEEGVDLCLETHPKWANKTEGEKAAKKEALVTSFDAAVEEQETRRSRTRARIGAGTTAVRGALGKGFEKGKGLFAKLKRESGEEQQLDIENMSDEEVEGAYSQARDAYAKVVHQDTTRAFLKLRRPGTAKRTKEAFEALQKAHLERNPDVSLQGDFLANLEALGEAEKKDKSPIYRSAKRFANSKTSAKILTGVTTGIALRLAGGAAAAATGGLSIGAAMALSRLRGINNARFKKDEAADSEHFYKVFESIGTLEIGSVQDMLEEGKARKTSELRKRMAKSVAITGAFAAAGYFGTDMIQHYNSTGGRISDSVDWVRNHTPLPDAKHLTGSPNQPNFSVKPHSGESLAEWKNRVSGGQGLTGEKAKAASTMFEIYQDPEKTRAFGEFIKGISTPEGQMNFARFDAFAQNTPNFDPVKFSNYLESAPKPSPEALSHAKNIAISAKNALGPNGPSLIGNIQGYLQVKPGSGLSPDSSLFTRYGIRYDTFRTFMDKNTDLAKELFGKNWKDLFSK